MARSSTLQNARVGFLLGEIKMSTYKKPYLTFPQQLDTLKQRGLEITDDKMA